MQYIGNIEPFVAGGNFPLYKDRIEQFFQANEVKDDKKVATFVTIIIIQKIRRMSRRK